MTVPYSNRVATSSFSCFLKLLFRWKGSIYKLLWKDFAVFAFFFYLLSFTYRFLLNEQLKRVFEMVATYCREFGDLIPLVFVLAFYVSIVIGRFWEQFGTIPYPHRMAMFVSALITGVDERGRMMRRTIMRYLCLAHLMTMAAISPPVKKRFPDYQHMTDAGFMLANEQRIIENMSTASNKYFVPLIWSASLVLRARKEGRIKDDFAVKTLIDEINDYRGKCGTLFAFDYVTVPLVYTQVVTIAVYMFFMSCLMGRQFLDNGKHGDLYFPLFTFLQFFFYMGWLKVAESLVNPFGEDDDDFEINSMIDNNLPTVYLIVDEMHNEHPELIKDQYWESFNRDIVVPYNEASQKFQTQEFLGSAANISIPPSKTTFLPSVASNLDRMGSQASVSKAAEGEQRTPKLGRKISKRLGRSTSRLSTIIKSSFSRQNSRLEVTKEDNESEIDIPLNNVNPKIADEEKLIASKQFPSELMFRMSIDEESNPSSPQASPLETNQSTNQPALPSMPSIIPTQIDPFISKPPLPLSQSTKAHQPLTTRTLSSSSTSSEASKNYGRIEINFDGKDGDYPQSPQPTDQPNLTPQTTFPSSLDSKIITTPPLNIPTSTQAASSQPVAVSPSRPPATDSPHPLATTPPHPLATTPTAQPPIQSPSTQPLPTHPPLSTHPSSASHPPLSHQSSSAHPPLAHQPSIHPPPSTHPHLSKAMPSTSLRPLDPVEETAESPEAFMGTVMSKLKEIRENK